MQYFTTGESYKAQVDMLRIQAVEDHLDVAMKLTGGGVIKGWNVYRDVSDGLFQITIEQGIGVVPVEAGNNGEWAANVPEN